MKQYYRFIKVIMCLLSSAFLTYMMALNTLTTILQVIFVYIYFLVISGVVLYCYERFLKHKVENKDKRKSIIISFIFVILILLCIGNRLFPKHYVNNQITISATGEKNDNSLGTEVWITGVNVDNVALDLSKISLETGWVYNADSYTIFGTSSETTLKPLLINIPEAKKIEIIFIKHGWSGIVNVSKGDQIENVDLYDPNGSTYSYITNGRYENISLNLKIVISLCFSILLYSFIFLSMQLILVNNKYKLFLYLLFIIVIFKISGLLVISKIEFMSTILFSILISIFNSALQINEFEIMIPCNKCNNKIKKYYTKGWFGVIFLISLCSSFFCIGYRLFLSGNSISLTIRGIATLVLFSIWFIPVILLGIYILETLFQVFSQNCVDSVYTKLDSKKVSLKLFLVFFVIWEIILIGYYPANMTYDSLVQWKQAIGLTQINNWHPAFDTIIIRILSYVFQSPFWVVSVQIVCMSLICSSFLVLLYKKGISFKLLLIIAFIIAILPNNFIMVTTLWKDIPYTISLLWLTYLIGKLSESPKYFLRNKYLVILLSICIICVKYFRHNGIIPYFMILSYLVYITIKNFKDIKFRALVTLTITLGLSFLIKGPVYNNIFHVQTGKEDKPYITMFTALGSVINKDCELSDKTTDILESIMSIQDWKYYYNRFNSDYYFYTHEGGMDLSAITLKQACSAYLEGLVKYPGIIIKDRLDGMNLLWDVTQPVESFNYKYSNGITFPIDIEPSILGLEFTDSANRLYLTNNEVTKVNNLLNRFITKIPLNEIFLYRSGVYLIIYLILLIFALRNKLYRIIAISIPFIGNTISWIVLMSHQSYRYIYYVAPCVLGIAIILLTTYSNELTEKDT